MDDDEYSYAYSDDQDVEDYQMDDDDSMEVGPETKENPNAAPVFAYGAYNRY